MFPPNKRFDNFTSLIGWMLRIIEVYCTVPPLIGLPSLRFYAVGSSLFLLSVCFVYVSYFIATMSFAGYFLYVLFCLLSMLISDSRFDLVWFRLSCDHGWIRSGSVNVRKQQQQQQQPGRCSRLHQQRGGGYIIYMCIFIF